MVFFCLSLSFFLSFSFIVSEYIYKVDVLVIDFYRFFKKEEEDDWTLQKVWEQRRGERIRKNLVIDNHRNYLVENSDLNLPWETLDIKFMFTIEKCEIRLFSEFLF